MDDIVKTVMSDPGVVHEAANKLHPNLQFNIENLIAMVIWPFWI